MHAPRTGDVTLNDILVPQSALADDAPEYALTAAIQDFQYMMEQHHVDLDQLSAEVKLSCNIDYYIGQVNNGGHSQYIANSGVDFALFENVEKALSLMGATRILKLHQQMHEWCRENPKAAAEQDGFSQREDTLDTLDDALYALSDTKHDYYKKSTAWLKSLPNLYPTSDTGWKRIASLLARNQPDFTAKQKLAQITNIGLQMNDPFMVALRMIGAQTHPLIEVYHQTAGSMVGHPDGSNDVVWALKTNTDIRAGYHQGGDVVLAKWQDSSFQKIESEIGRMPTGDADALIDGMWDANVPVALFVMLRDAGLKSGKAYISVLSPSSLRVTFGKQILSYDIGNTHVLTDATGKAIATVPLSRAAHLADIAANSGAIAFEQALEQ
ncbi:MAG: DMP19 family protein [Planktomarina sp.]